MHFNPRAPCGARRNFVHGFHFVDLISIHAPRVGRDVRDAFARDVVDISIHAPRVGRDPNGCGRRAGIQISIHAPRVGRDIVCQRMIDAAAGFQSTRPVWGATYADNTRLSTGSDFNPRAPCGARRFLPTTDLAASPISIHAPRVGRDDVSCRRRKPQLLFQSTRPVWGATLEYFQQLARVSISIHAPRVGRDHSGFCIGKHIYRFQSTRPVWGATAEHAAYWVQCEFQSTRPVWGATLRPCAPSSTPPISIHAPRVGRDAVTDPVPHGENRFQSTRPVWGATQQCRGAGLRADISIHAPRVGRDLRNAFNRCFDSRFQSTRPVWGATLIVSISSSMIAFQSTRPVWGATLEVPAAVVDAAISIHAPRVGRDGHTPVWSR